MPRIKPSAITRYYMRLTLLIMTFYLFNFSFIFCQRENPNNVCSTEKLAGRWNYVTSQMEYEPVNLNLLLAEADTIDSKHLSLTFDSGEVLTMYFTYTKKAKAYYCLIDSKTCNIHTSRKKNSKRQKQMEILLLNDEYLVTRKRNPHAFTVVVYRRNKENMTNIDENPAFTN